MSYFERRAEERFFFDYRATAYTSAHFHSNLELIFVERGEVEIIVNGERRTLKRGDACFIDGFGVHGYEDALESRAYILLIKRNFFEGFLSRFQNQVPPRFFRFENFELLKTLRRVCGQNYTNEGSRYVAFEGALGVLLASISSETPFTARHREKSAELVCAVLEYAEENLAGDLSLRALAKRFGYSYEYLSRLLTKTLAENWNAYINRVRVRKAHERLQAQENASVLQIALECGFESSNTFYRAYKKEYGVSPRRN